MTRRRLLVTAVALAAVCAAVLVGRWTAPANDRAEPQSLDVSFSQAMIAHHQQAVLMTRVVDGRLSLEMSRVARAIADDQLREIGVMQGWLLLWNRPVTATGDAVAWMDAHGEMASMSGDGVADLQQTSTPAATDRLFASLMVSHHRAGISMASFAARNSRTSAVALLARQMVVDETQEIQMMTALTTMTQGS